MIYSKIFLTINSTVIYCVPTISLAVLKVLGIQEGIVFLGILGQVERKQQRPITSHPQPLSLCSCVPFYWPQTLSDLKLAQLARLVITSSILLLKAAAAEDLGHRLVRKKKRNVSYKS